MLDFEWDEAKAEANFAKHGVSFETATLVFDDPLGIDIEDRRWNYGEERRIVIGQAEGQVLTVVYTLRGDAIRLISARLASRLERREYAEAQP